MSTYRTRYSMARHSSQTYEGHHFHSKFEAGVYKDLIEQKREGLIVDVETQFLCECVPYAAHLMPDGSYEFLPVQKKIARHRVDFRVEKADGSFELIEAKGLKFNQWKDVRDSVLKFWLPMHPDHEYLVIEDRGGNYRRKALGSVAKPCKRVIQHH